MFVSVCQDRNLVDFEVHYCCSVIGEGMEDSQIGFRGC